MQNLRGVNLGGWLVLERWVTPSLFSGLDVWDEYSFCRDLGGLKAERLKTHRESFITKEDFRWIVAHGLNAVRIPIGHWVFGNAEPYVAGIEYLDFAMDAAANEGLKVVIDLHGAEGSQNGWKHSGQAGRVKWHKGRHNIEATLDVVEHLAERYKDHRALTGIELLNEPSSKIPHKVLTNFYQRGYEAVRRHCGVDVAVIISDGFKPHEWQQALLPPAYQNVWLDCHLYQVFSSKDKVLSVEGHVRKAQSEWSGLINRLQVTHPVMVGEWSAALDLKGLNQIEQEAALKSYTAAQIATFSQSQAWFYWTYKTEQESAWSLRCMIEKGLINTQEKQS